MLVDFNPIREDKMKKWISMLTLIAIIISCTSKKTKLVNHYNIEQFYKNKNIYGGTFSPDEFKLLTTSNETGIYNLFVIPVDGGTPSQLTYSTQESYFAVSYFPHDDRVLFHADQGGNENDHLYLLDESNQITDLTPFENAKIGFYGWSRDETSGFYVSTKRDPRYFDLYETPIDQIQYPHSHDIIYKNDDGFEIGSISHDKKYLTLTRNITTTNNELYLFNLETKEQIHISQHKGDAEYSPQFFDLSNENLYFLTNENSEYMYLAKYNLKTQEKETVFQTDWDVWYAYNSYNEKYRVIGVNEDAKTTVTVLNLETNKKVKIPTIKNSSISSVSISKSEKLIRLTASSSATPSNIYVYNFESKKLKKLTNTLNPEIEQMDLVEGKVVRFKSFDGLEIPAIYYQPHTASSSNKVPALVWVHGGPGGQSRLSYFALIQYLVNHDYAILAVNNRGSSGYGKSFYKMDDQKHGDLDLKDCIAGKDFLAGSKVIDPAKIGIIGGSYGGYMVMAALTFAPEEFDAGVNIFGVTNWLRTLKSIPPYWESYREALYTELGDPFTQDSVRLYNISPLFHADKVSKPLIVLQGTNDPRVLQVESDEMVAAVKENNVPVEYVLFADEGHGFLKKENEIKGYGQVKIFLDTYLKGKSDKK